MLTNILKRMFAKNRVGLKHQSFGRMSHPSATLSKSQPIADLKNDTEVVTDTQTKKLELTPYQLWLIHSKSVERPFTGHLWSEKQMGYYHCVVCASKLFSWNHKFIPATGTASFWGHFPGKVNKVAEEVDLDWSNYQREGRRSLKHQRVECSTCGSHLGVVFFDGPAPTHLRYSINSVMLQFRKVGFFPNPHIARKQQKRQEHAKRFIPIRK